MSNIFIEPPRGTLFSFENYGCTCSYYTLYESDGSKSYWIQVIPNKNKKIEFFHDYKVGLYWINDEINSNQKNKENEKKEIDVIGVLPKSYGVKTLLKDYYTKDEITGEKIERIIQHNEEEFTKGIVEFFKRFGFFFDLPEFPVRISVDELKNLIDRIFIVEHLSSALKNKSNESDYDYNKIFYYTFMLALSNTRSLYFAEREFADCPVFESPVHPLAKVLNGGYEVINKAYTRKDLKSITDSEIFDIVEKALTEHAEQTKRKVTAHFEHNLPKQLEEHYRAYQRSFETDDEYDAKYKDKCYVIEDYFIDKKIPAIDKREQAYKKMIEQFVETKEFNPDIIDAYYMYSNQQIRREKIFFDFLYHFKNEIDTTIDINQDDFNTINLTPKLNLLVTLKFDSKFKEKILELAKETLKNEFDAVLKSVSVKFNANDMAPGWYIPDFFTAIYYSIFLNSGNNIIRRACANPECAQTFAVNISNRQQQFCNPSCSAILRQKRYNATHPRSAKQSKDSKKENNNEAMKVDE